MVYSNDGNILTKKTKYFLLYFWWVLKKLIHGIKVNQNSLFLYISPIHMLHSLTFLKGNSISSFNSLADIAVVDNVSLLKTRFELSYVFWNKIYEYRLGIKLFTDGLKTVYSVTGLYSSAVWLEREVWDMFGIKFLFHKGLRRILTDYGFKGHPLRKDFPLLGYVDVYYDDSIQSIKVRPIELSQSLRFYKFESPWNKWYF